MVYNSLLSGKLKCFFTSVEALRSDDDGDISLLLLTQRKQETGLSNPHFSSRMSVSGSVSIDFNG